MFIYRNRARERERDDEDEGNDKRAYVSVEKKGLVCKRHCKNDRLFVFQDLLFFFVKT